METTVNKIVKRSKTIDYTKSGVIISNTKDTKTIIISEKEKNVKTKKSNTCFNVKNVGCSGLANLFFNQLIKVRESDISLINYHFKNLINMDTIFVNNQQFFVDDDLGQLMSFSFKD